MTSTQQEVRDQASYSSHNPSTKEMANMGKGRSQGSPSILKWDQDKRISHQALRPDHTVRA